MEQKYQILQLKEVEKTIIELEKFLKEEIFQKFQKKGAVIGISGGIDSAVMAAICSKSVDSNQILGIIMPEKESDHESESLAKKVEGGLVVWGVALSSKKEAKHFAVQSKPRLRGL